MNYIIEDNLDFQSALLNDEELEPACCLISQQPLTKSHITLPCKHTFNYKPLFKEIYVQKTIRNMYESARLKLNQLKCPYCRSISEFLLPYLPSEELEKKNGVNSPSKYCMPCNIECDWSIPGKSKQGQNKPGKSTPVKNKCLKPACYIGSVNYCKTHYLKVQKNQTNQTIIPALGPVLGPGPDTAPAPAPEPIHIQWTTAMTMITHTKTVVELREILRLHKFKVSGNKKALIERIFGNNLIL